MIATEDMVALLRERDEQHFALVDEHVKRLEDKMKALLLAQAEMEAYDWDKLDDLDYLPEEMTRHVRKIRSGR